jgi:hypothetical protein
MSGSLTIRRCCGSEADLRGEDVFEVVGSSMLSRPSLLGALLASNWLGALSLEVPSSSFEACLSLQGRLVQLTRGQ